MGLWDDAVPCGEGAWLTSRCMGGGAWQVRMGWGREARGRRQAAGGRQQAAGELPTKLVQVEAVLAQVELHVRPDDAVHHGYVLSCRSRSVAERYLRRRAKHAWRRRRAAESMMMRMTRVRMWHKHGVLRWRDDILSNY